MAYIQQEQAETARKTGILVTLAKHRQLLKADMIVNVNSATFIKLVNTGSVSSAAETNQNWIIRPSYHHVYFKAS